MKISLKNKGDFSMSEKDITNKQAEATMNPIVVDMNQRYQYLLLYIYNVSLIQSKS